MTSGKITLGLSGKFRHLDEEIPVNAGRSSIHAVRLFCCILDCCCSHISDILRRTPRFERYRFVKACLDLKVATDEKLKVYFKQLFVEGDDNGDGVLEYSEFDAIVHKINPELGREEVVAMFREAILHPANETEDEDAMCPEAFSSVAYDHGLQNFVESAFFFRTVP